MAKKAWSDPEKSAQMMSKIPLGRFAGLPLIYVFIILDAFKCFIGHFLDAFVDM